MAVTPVKHEFKAEIKQLLNILVHSLYTSREIFFRELISNASDALDKLRFEFTRNNEVYEKDSALEIKIDFDSEKHTITITDSGIGMSEDELISNIGTIAKSGSIEFLQKMQEDKQAANNIIGKFGVGFYSVFMVAKEVVITSKSFRPEIPGIRWKSDGLGEYELEQLADETPRGTKIEIFLKEDATEFSTKFRIEEIIKRHSNFISFPIFLENEKINTVSAIWREPKSKITKEQYAEFYKFLSYDTDEPADTIHISIDAPIQFNSLMFIPKKNGDYFGFNRENYGLDLYVRRVLIQHKNKDLLPEYLNFVKGLVDSEDLPLNISRETLQENIVFTKIAASVTSQVLSYLIKKAKDEPEQYAEFWNEHGKMIKLGYGDYANQDKLFQLLRFNSSFNEDDKSLTSLEQYVEQMKPEQKEIYYVFGPNRTALASNPLLEVFKTKNVPVFYVYDQIDEFVLSSLRKYKEFEFHSVDKSNLSKLDEIITVSQPETKATLLSSEDQAHFEKLLAKMKEIIGDRILSVNESKRLTSSAVCLVQQDDGIMGPYQKMMRLTNKNMPPERKILEVNKDNLLIRNLLELFKRDENNEYVNNMVIQLFEIAQLTDGDLQDVHTLAKRLTGFFEESSKMFLLKSTD